MQQNLQESEAQTQSVQIRRGLISENACVGEVLTLNYTKRAFSTG